MRHVLLVAGCVFATPAHAAFYNATPATFASVAAQAKAGDTIKLSSGDYGNVSLPAANHLTPVTIDAREARLVTLSVSGTKGWRWVGGMINTPVSQAYVRNILILNSARVEVSNVYVRYGRSAVHVIYSQDVTVRSNNIMYAQEDGIDVVASQRVMIVGNTIAEFRPLEPVYENGVLVKDAPHVDAIQMWSMPNYAPTSDVTILANRIAGKGQGITHFWHAHEGRPKVDRITVEKNDLTLATWWGIGMLDATNAKVRNNVVRTLPNAARMRARLIMAEGQRCGNVVEFEQPDAPC